MARIRGACDTVSQYLPHDVREALIQSYEYVLSMYSFSCKRSPRLPQRSVSPHWMLISRPLKRRTHWQQLMARTRQEKTAKTVRSGRLQGKTLLVLQNSRKSIRKGWQSYPLFLSRKRRTYTTIYRFMYDFA